jgi:hypothetical protein
MKRIIHKLTTFAIYYIISEASIQSFLAFFVLSSCGITFALKRRFLFP